MQHGGQPRLAALRIVQPLRQRIDHARGYADGAQVLLPGLGGFLKQCLAQELGDDFTVFEIQGRAIGQVAASGVYGGRVVGRNIRQPVRQQAVPDTEMLIEFAGSTAVHAIEQQQVRAVLRLEGHAKGNQSLLEPGLLFAALARLGHHGCKFLFAHVLGERLFGRKIEVRRQAFLRQGQGAHGGQATGQARGINFAT